MFDRSVVNRKPGNEISISIFKDGWTNAFRPWRWCRKGKSNQMESYKIPLFLEKIIVHPNKYYDSINKTIKSDYLDDMFGKNNNKLEENDHLRDQLLKIVIAS